MNVEQTLVEAIGLASPQLEVELPPPQPEPEPEPVSIHKFAQYLLENEPNG